MDQTAVSEASEKKSTFNAEHSQNAPISSRIPGFYERSHEDRLAATKTFCNLNDDSGKALSDFGVLSPELVDTFIENGVGAFSLPLGIATNFYINGVDFLIPMAVEESSVVAAASHGAKFARAGGGFTTSSTAPLMTGQIQLYLGRLDIDFDGYLTSHREELLRYAEAELMGLVSRGGGAKDLTWRLIPEIESLIIHLIVDTRDAMGANLVNTMCERLADYLCAALPHCQRGLRILTNLCDQRLARVSCEIPAVALTSGSMTQKPSSKKSFFAGEQVVDGIVRAYSFSRHDIYRATTNNKGIMNGIDPVVIATGNDWRAVEAGAHAYASRSGTYLPMATWSKTSDGHLRGEMELPIAVGVVGGVTRLHPTAQAALELLGFPSAQKLAEIIVAVGLAQNLSALRALATEGIQRGHMGLHQKNLELLNRQKKTF